MMVIREILLQWFINFFFDKKSSGGVVKSEMMQNKQLVEELHKTIIRKLEKESILIF